MKRDSRPAAHAKRHAADVAERRPIVRLLHGVNRLYARNFHHIDILSPAKLPRQGKAILVCNHTSGLDPLLIQSACQRRIVWMMAREYYELPALCHVFKTLDAIPVDRSGRDVVATRAAMRALHDGAILGIFPEGKISKNQDLCPFEPGVALMALKTQTQIYPAAIDGSHRGDDMGRSFATSHDARLAFGEPFNLGKTPDGMKPDLQTSTGRIRDAILQLLSLLRVDY